MWLYHRFPLSFREAGELMLARGAIVSCGTIRQWCAKFGPTYARALRRRRSYGVAHREMIRSVEPANRST